MKKLDVTKFGKRIWNGSLCLAAAVFTLCACSKDESDPPLAAGDVAVDVVLTPRGFRDQIYTSYLYMIPFIKGYGGVNVEKLLTKDIFRLSLVSPRSGATIELKMHESELNEEVVEQYTLPRSGDTLWMQPRMVWNYDALRRFDRTRNLALRWTISADGREICTVNRTFSGRSVNQGVNALFLYPYERPQGLAVNEDGAIEIPEMFAGYVEEENPEIDRILEQALREVFLPSGFNDYQSGSEDYLLQQMCAVWYVLQQSGVSYSNATNIPGRSENVRVQNIRFFSQALASAQANCVEGTCMLASIYQRINLFPYLILTPNHMFLGIGDKEGNLTYFLETTMIGKVKLDALATAEEKWEASKANFKDAMATAKKEFEEVKSHVDAEDPYYAVIDLREARKIIPSINYGSVRTDSKGKVVLVR